MFNTMLRFVQGRTHQSSDPREHQGSDTRDRQMENLHIAKRSQSVGSSNRLKNEFLKLLEDFGWDPGMAEIIVDFLSLKHVSVALMSLRTKSDCLSEESWELLRSEKKPDDSAAGVLLSILHTKTSKCAGFSDTKFRGKLLRKRPRERFSDLDTPIANIFNNGDDTYCCAIQFEPGKLLYCDSQSPTSPPKEGVIEQMMAAFDISINEPFEITSCFCQKQTQPYKSLFFALTNLYIMLREPNSIPLTKVKESTLRSTWVDMAECGAWKSLLKKDVEHRGPPVTYVHRAGSGIAHSGSTPTLIQRSTFSDFTFAFDHFKE